MNKPVASVPQVSRWGLGVAVVSLLLIAWATLRPEPGQTTTSHFCVICGDFGGEDAVLNVGLFFPLGLGLALYGIRPRQTILVGCALSTLIELTQLFLVPGRDATIGDVLMNTIGTAIGALLVRSSPTWLVPSHRNARQLLVSVSVVWLVIQSIASFAFVISLPNSKYYGQLARKIGNLELFEGRVDRVRINTLPIGNTAVPATSQVRSALNKGESLDAVIEPAAPTVGIAPIVRIADENEREILILAQRGDAALFAVRTGATELRLRAPIFELLHALPDSEHSRRRASGPIAIRAGYNGRSAHLLSTDRVSPVAEDWSVRSSMAWMTLMPFTWSVRGTVLEAVLSMIWTSLLLIPIGYWASLYVRTSPVPSLPRTIAVLSFLLVLMIVGLILIPFATSIATASLLDFTAAILGLLASSFFSYLLRLPRPATFHETTRSP